MILMRHGQSHFNVHYAETRKDPGLRDPGLTDLGRSQVAVAAAHLKQEQQAVRRIVASPYTRSLETADIVRQVLDLPVAVDPTVGERAVFTCDIGTPRSHLEARWPDIEKQGFDQRFRRMWHYYLAYCEAAFLEGLTNVGIYRFTRPHG